MKTKFIPFVCAGLAAMLAVKDRSDYAFQYP